jgi:hypothetical protein
MAFHIDANVLPRIHGYDQARELFNSITPIRGGDQSVRRIGKRNDASKWLKHEIRDGVDVFIAGFHRSKIVEYYPTHYNLSMCHWNSLSTQLFIFAITGNRCGSVRHSEYIPRGFSAEVGTADAMYADYPIRSSEAYKFDYDDKPLQEMPVLNKYKVNRKRMNEVRKQASPFIEYMGAMHNLAPDNDDSGSNYWSSPYRTTEAVVREISNTDLWWDMFECIAWNTQGRKYDVNTGKVTYIRNIQAMRNWVDGALKAHSPHVLDVV